MSKSSLVVLGFIVMSVIGCATTSLDSDEAVAKRAQERLDALVAGDFAKAYSYATPAYRKTTSLLRHKPKIAGAGMWTEGTVKRVQCEGSVCDVTVLVSYEMVNLDLKNTRPMEQRWIKSGNQWWIYHK
jgi:hypothetical protein